MAVKVNRIAAPGSDKRSRMSVYYQSLTPRAVPERSKSFRGIKFKRQSDQKPPMILCNMQIQKGTKASLIAVFVESLLTNILLYGKKYYI